MHLHDTEPLGNGAVTIRRTWLSNRPFAQSFTDLDHEKFELLTNVSNGTSLSEDDGESSVDFELLRRPSLQKPEDFAKAPQTKTLDIRGFLYKLDAIFGLLWLDRYFCVQADRLCWYTYSRPFLTCGLSLQHDIELEGDDSISLKDVTEIEYVGTVRGRQHCFNIHYLEDNRLFSVTVHAPTLPDANHWIDCLRMALEDMRRPDPFQERALRYFPQNEKKVLAPGLSRTPRQACITGSYTVREKKFPYVRHTKYYVTVTAFSITVEHRYNDFDELAGRLLAAGWTPTDCDGLDGIDGLDPVTASSLSSVLSGLSTSCIIAPGGSSKPKTLKKIPKLPPKAFFNMHYKFVKTREAKLNKFLQTLVAGTDALLVHQDPLRQVHKLTPAGQIIRDFFIPKHLSDHLTNTTTQFIADSDSDDCDPAAQCNANACLLSTTTSSHTDTCNTHEANVVSSSQAATATASTTTSTSMIVQNDNITTDSQVCCSSIPQSHVLSANNNADEVIVLSCSLSAPTSV
eukprot:TRINITY_DN14901_c0_g1::TRINITY_DN14901_c0_g1_i1::g.16272::m.16272 TRINITY_DN14901_c0_g1::TRINITY_DN14901_c0_g1_i1::g.16272  ORF type:complete len:515 (+),score=51.05,PX/PF00787.19/1.5e-07,PH/PF00169.24/1.9e-05,PH/PF00169.24/3.4e+03,Bac_globin/PF01152.16/50,Bac_globin/PF01152.16/1.3 TRINITY_DN14901_c0_g1_i1:84-1628(+)